jgi:hypothetical protein
MDEALERLLAFQRAMPWKTRKTALHEQLARSLFVERGQRGLLREFEAKKKALIANPYGSSSKS